ncbi:hypothetical protein GCM10007103_32720 [Salinimicrobium marinum]|uniref:Methyltransferase domain-containing protein n=1 Tax=Salinimicrobium marinum TaxID=680283 RepID=A0A918W1F8_9FLAO|nr:class I SAM-dependent methyltransferase [Salinimicrobium marinum]GHA49354.1 hypothetical protein GCM10007103_32720 [Salinimicrobium marinum]
MRKVVEFYNKFDKKLIDDYVLGNRRIESAIINLSKFIPVESTNILDIGCGLGWSSHEFAKNFPAAKIEGVDLSPVLIDTASKLFDLQNLTYQVYDLTKSLPKTTYDAVVMIDVYEHVQKHERKKFHESLRFLLKKQGRLILACPSKYHQTWLKETNPAGLQPIDEDVDFMVIADLAQGINGEIIFFEYQKIWRSYDYFYAVIEIHPVYNAISPVKTNTKIKLEETFEKIYRAKERLGLDYEKAKIQTTKKLSRKLVNKILKTLRKKKS